MKMKVLTENITQWGVMNKKEKHVPYMRLDLQANRR